MELGKTIKGIIFDLDGTLFDLQVDWPGLRLQLEKELDQKFASFDEILQIGAGPQKDMITQLIDAAEMEGVVNGEVLPGAGDVLQKLSQTFKLAVVTRNGREASLSALNELKLDGIILVSRDEVSQLKPHPEALQLALEKMKLQPKEVIVVGDTVHDVLAAHNLQMQSVVVKNSKLAFSPPDSDFYIESINQLPDIIEEINS